MQIERKAGEAPATRDIAKDLAMLRGTCVECPGCRGLCWALIEALTLPEAVLSRD